jgi:hypothetical protein
MRDQADRFFSKWTIVVSALLFVLSSCSTEKEIVRPVEPPPPPPPPPVVEKPVPTPPPPPAPKLRVSLQCREDTRHIFNRCGIEALPFVRTAFYDMDGDGVEELIAGSKDGSLRLYKNYGTAMDPEWKVNEDYFRGVSSGAFSSPAAGDIDDDGKPEIIVGTGGFSSDSGKVLVFRNLGTAAEPIWKKVEMPDIRVGNDAAPAVVATGGKGKPDLVVGNSEGHLFLFRNVSKNGHIAFRKDAAFFRGVRLGMYIVPAVFSKGDKIHLMVGNDMGKLYLFEHANGKGGWNRTTLRISTAGFASPSFIRTSGPQGPDLVVADGSGQIRYFRNVKGNFRDWEESPALFAGRILPGPVCTPVMGDRGDERWMTSGNAHGEMKLFEFDSPSGGMLPVERKQFFKGIKLSGFSKGVLTEWQEKALLVTGQQDGLIRAFINSGSKGRPLWNEQKNFFAGLPKMMHASPAIFDLDADGTWELIVGDVDGRVQGFRYETAADGSRAWERIEGVFDRVKVGRFASPALVRDAGTIYLLVGEQDGRISVFTAADDSSKAQVFQPDGLLEGILVKDHSSPSAITGNGGIELAVGDYDGNLRHFACKKVFVEAKGK